MFTFKAESKFVDLSKSLKIYYILATGIFLCILAFLVYQNIIVTVTLVVCTVLTYFILSKPKQLILLQISDESIKIDNDTLPWQSCLAWSLVDLERSLEFAIKTSNLTNDFYYFYISKNNPQLPQIISALNNFIPYDEKISRLNVTHSMLRNLGLK